MSKNLDRILNVLKKDKAKSIMKERICISISMKKSFIKEYPNMLIEYSY